jgi:hypothetical protein
MQLFTVLRIMNIPIFTFPGFACMYEGIGFYNMVLIYLALPVLMLVYTYLVYVFIQYKLPSRYCGHKLHRNHPMGVPCGMI